MIENEDQARDFVAAIADSEAMACLETLIGALRIENAQQNLVAQATLAMVWQRHIADSAQLLTYAGEFEGPWLDLGSGAGFPGLVIAAIRPHAPVILVESRKRRIDWLSQMCSVLGLSNCKVIGSRLEAVEAFDAGVISARAFAPLPRLLDLSARFSTVDTLWVLPKGRSAAQEVRELPKRGRTMFHVEQSQTDAEAGIVVGRGKWSPKG